MRNDLLPFFNPRGVAVIGASSNPAKLSFGIFKNLTQYGYQGGIYPVNPNAKEILGLPCFPDIGSVPDPVDLAVSVIGGNQTPNVLEACGKRGIKAVTIISGGFREVGQEGDSLEKRCIEIAHDYGIRMVGPNCVGTMDLHSGLNTTFIYGIPDKGHIGFLSQSGAICGGIVDYVRGKKVGFSNFVSLGNMADMNETDFIEYLAEDDNTTVITLYIEGISDGRRFVEVARRVSKHKPILILKAGKTQAGAHAVSSHTGSIAGSHAAYRAAFRQAGVIEVDTIAELFNLALAFDLQPAIRGKRTAILTNSGGPAALASDSLAQNGLQLAEISNETKALLRARLNTSAQVDNPVDMLGGAEATDYGAVLDLLAKDPQVDLLLPILVPQALINPAAVANEIVRAIQNCTKPVMTCMMGDQVVMEAREILHGHGVPMYVFPDEVGMALGALGRQAEWAETTVEAPIPLVGCDMARAREYFQQVQSLNSLGEAATRPLLDAYGIDLIQGEFAGSAQAAVEVARRIGGLVVLKVVSPDLLHKSDAGGILLGVNGADEDIVRLAYQEMVGRIAQTAPEAHIDGVMVEAMAAKGQELIVGMRRDPNFGPMLMFGLGGIYVELFADVAFRIAPVSREEALAMIHETKAGKLLSGFRGQKPADVEAVIDCIQRLGQLALDFPEISEIEINPLMVYEAGQGVLALDCRAVL
jgi:acetyl coenzyme A synthetase (ADP forming)-like protein